MTANDVPIVMNEETATATLQAETNENSNVDEDENSPPSSPRSEVLQSSNDDDDDRTIVDIPGHVDVKKTPLKHSEEKEDIMSPGFKGMRIDSDSGDGESNDSDSVADGTANGEGVGALNSFKSRINYDEEIEEDQGLSQQVYGTKMWYHQAK